MAKVSEAVKAQRKAFGRFLQALRGKYIFYKNGLETGWTPEKLAEETKGKVTASVIRHLEAGDTAIDPERHLKPLADAFGLTVFQRHEFYAKAGFLYKPAPIDIEDIVGPIAQFLREIRYPAFAETPMSDLVAANSYYLQIYGHDEKQVAAMKKGVLGANVMRIFFDEKFGRTEYRGGKNKWEHAVVRNIRIFKIHSFPYLGTKRYKTIYNGLMSEFNKLGFPIYWDRADSEPEEVGKSPVSPKIEALHHPTFGVMSFWVLGLPWYRDTGFSTNIYVPDAESVGAYEEFAKTVESNEVTYLKDPEEWLTLLE